MQGPGVDLNPAKTALVRLKELIQTSVVLGCELHRDCVPAPQGWDCCSSQKMQRGVESPVLGKAQIGPVFGKSAKAEVSALWSWKVQPWGTGDV